VLPRVVLAVTLLAGAPLRAQTTAAHATEAPAGLDVMVAHATTGGVWRSHGSHGHYRLVVYDATWDRTSSRLVIQWIEEDPVQHRLTVKDSRLVGIIPDTWSLSAPQFVQHPRGIRATVAGTDSHNGHTATWILALGPPGQFSISPVR
jgi:hypothetical protein